MAIDVLALYDTRDEAQKAVSALENAGFDRSDISIEAYDSTDTMAGTGQTQESGWNKLMDKLHLSSAPKEHTDYYAQGLQSGNTLVTVTTGDENADAAADILNHYDTVDLDTSSSQYYAGSGGTTDTTVSASAPTIQTVAPNDQVVIPIVEEELVVGKRDVQRGGVRVYERVTERPVEQTVTLRDETVTVNRRPVDRAVTDADMAFKEGSFEVIETDEEAVVAKNIRVVEEVVVGKTTEQRTETVRDTVRRTDVEVEEINATDVRSTTR